MCIHSHLLTNGVRKSISSETSEKDYVSTENVSESFLNGHDQDRFAGHSDVVPPCLSVTVLL